MPMRLSRHAAADSSSAAAMGIAGCEAPWDACCPKATLSLSSITYTTRDGTGDSAAGGVPAATASRITDLAANLSRGFLHFQCDATARNLDYRRLWVNSEISAVNRIPHLA